MPYLNIKDRKTKTVNLLEKHLKVSTVKDIKAGYLSFWDIGEKQINFGTLKATVFPALEEGYSVVLHFQGKKRILWYPDKTPKNAVKGFIGANTHPWKKQPIKGSSHCPCCPATVDVLPLETKLFSGMGGWSITKNGQPFFEEDQDKDFDDCRDIKYVEELIGEDNENEYIAYLFMALRDATYQRHAKNTWVLIGKGPGYA